MPSSAFWVGTDHVWSKPTEASWERPSGRWQGGRTWANWLCVYLVGAEIFEHWLETGLARWHSLPGPGTWATMQEKASFPPHITLLFSKSCRHFFPPVANTLLAVDLGSV